MKKNLIITTLILISTSLKAEYEGYRIQFSIEAFNGNISIGYVEFPSQGFNMDSLKSTEALKEILNKYENGDQGGDFIYFKEKIKYEFIEVNDSSYRKQVIFHLTDKTTLPFELIKRIKTNEIEKFSYCKGIMIANELESSDTTWMKSNPVKKIYFVGYFNSFQIFVHKNSSEIKEIIKQLELKQKEINGIEIITDDSGYSENGHKMDEDLLRIIQRFNKQEVVVIRKYDC